MMKATVALLLTFVAVAPGVAGQKRPSLTGVIDRVSLEATVDPEEVQPGHSATLKLNIKPDKNIRVFAHGADEYTEVRAILMPPKGVKSIRPSFVTKPEKQKNPGNKKTVPLYSKAFRLEHEVTLDEKVKPGTDIQVTGAVTYQAFDEKNVYAKRTMPVRWTIHVAKP
jgi:hypothetical protein